MAENTGFQHISVIPAEEEEIVIQAGAAKAVAPVVEAVAPVVEAAPQVIAAVSDADAKAEAQLAAAEVTGARFSTALHEAIAEEQVKKPAKTGYRETTLEDLEPTPMNPLQKTVFMVLMALLVVFGAYCGLKYGLHLF